MEYTHTPVLLEQCMEGLAVKPDGVYVDCTFGRGGHSLAILERLSRGRLVAIDRDQAALDAAPGRLGDHMKKVALVHGNFGDVASILDTLGIPAVDGMLFDLGVSSPQLDDPSRGFSYSHEAKLDMRMDRSASLTAYEVVNTWSREELKRILWEYGEERYSGLIAAAIVRAREQKPIETTTELAGLICAAMPGKARHEKQHPARRSFQAIRMAVNQETGELERALSSVLPKLKQGGRLAVISFHSLEDRLVKTTFAQWARGCTCPPDLPVCVCGKKPQVKLIGRRPIVAEEEETRENPRAHSAKLRVAEKL